MREVTRFQTSDEKLFADKEDALRHERLLKFSAWYAENTLHGTGSSAAVKWNDLTAWLKENKRELEEILASLAD